MTPESLILWATAKQRECYGYSQQAGRHSPADEEAVQYWLGQRDAFGSLIRHLSSAPPSPEMDLSA